MKKIKAVAICFILVFLFSLFACKSENAHRNRNHSHAKHTESGSFPIRFSPKWHPQAQFAGIYMAIEKGIYAQHGLDVQLMSTISSDDALDRLAQNELDIAHFDLSFAIQANQDSTRIVNVGQISQKNSVMLVAKKNRGYSSISNFQDKRLGIWHRTSHIVTEAFLRQNDLNMQQIPIDWSVNVFIHDAVDVINVMRYNEYHQLLLAGFSEDQLFVVDLCDWGLDVPDEGFYVSPQFYKDHPQECQAFLEATLDGWLYAFSHPKEAIDLVLDIMQEANIRANRAHQSWMLEQMKSVVMPSAAEMGILKQADYEKALELSNQYMGFNRNMTYEEFYPNGTQ